jgi:uncharacterized membrane protein (UPF0127 family)
MALFERILTKVGNLRIPGNSKSQSFNLQVSNLTRQAVLATAVDVADTSATRRKGLLGRKGLASGEGMWIVPGEAVHTFGMQFPIDLVYLDRHHTIRKIKHNVPPGRISGCFSAHSVLELAPGSIRETETKIGDQLLLARVPREA